MRKTSSSDGSVNGLDSVVGCSTSQGFKLAKRGAALRTELVHTGDGSIPLHCRWGWADRGSVDTMPRCFEQERPTRFLLSVRIKRSVGLFQGSMPTAPSSIETPPRRCQCNWRTSATMESADEVLLGEATPQSHLVEKDGAGSNHPEGRMVFHCRPDLSGRTLLFQGRNSRAAGGIEQRQSVPVQLLTIDGRSQLGVPVVGPRSTDSAFYPGQDDDKLARVSKYTVLV